jgi:hypothetical protein
MPTGRGNANRTLICHPPEPERRHLQNAIAVNGFAGQALPRGGLGRYRL